MKLENKILFFLLLALIYSSFIYLIGQKQETEIELDISNALLSDLLDPKFDDRTYVNDWIWTTYDGIPRYELKNNGCNDINSIGSCSQHRTFSNQTLNGTTHIRMRAPMNVADIIFAYFRYGGK